MVFIDGKDFVTDLYKVLKYFTNLYYNDNTYDGIQASDFIFNWFETCILINSIMPILKYYLTSIIS